VRQAGPCNAVRLLAVEFNCTERRMYCTACVVCRAVCIRNSINCLLSVNGRRLLNTNYVGYVDNLKPLSFNPPVFITRSVYAVLFYFFVPVYVLLCAAYGVIKNDDDDDDYLKKNKISDVKKQSAKRINKAVTQVVPQQNDTIERSG